AQELDGRQQLIGHELGRVSDQMAQLDRMLRELETDRRERFGELATELSRQHQAVDSLHQTTQQLREALASSKVRGQWGERMAEDVLRLAGLIEGVNYRKQHTLTTGGRPDFTFLLPNGQQLHMDVKFPLDNYVRYLECESDLERKQHRDQFLKDVRECVKGLARRRYLEADDPTIDCLLLFIPNEAVYAFLQQHDTAIADAALREKIVLCSPLTLYAVLAVIRQAVDNFRLEQASHEILGLLGDFRDQWGRYVEQLEKVQQRFESVQKEYGALMTTRQRALQRPLDKIEALRQEQRLDDEEAANRPALTPLALDA
ncbi:MAG TPA: DNA recombination protein RmuC, partial [Acidimicrobiia bacterium]|nr:DNA recombination protein RmuC [Acidimicrobiia bacterium]